MRSKKGFTLIELLGVIVILALLVLIAVPAITRIMTTSTKNSFKNETVSFVSDLEKAFAMKMSKEVISNQSCNTTDIYNITASDGKGYAYLCMTLSQLVNEQITKKNLGQSYGGYIQMWVPDGSGETITFVNVTEGRYFVQGRMSEVSKSNFVASQTPYSGSDIQKPTQSTACPSSCSTIPSSSIMNHQDN